MDIEKLRDYCLNKKAVSEEFPFDSQTLVFKLAGKIFLLTGIENFSDVNVKCDPEKAIELRELYTDVIPGYHMNKKHWNTLKMNGVLTDKFILEQVDHSYVLILNSLPLKIKKEIIA
jgi:predicted DNA-binding protein (MmcQ/YjbR family)